MRARRSGFSLVELLVVAVLGTITLAAAYQMLVVQQRGFSHESARMQAQRTGRVTLQVLATELREISPVASDLLRAEDSVLTVRASRKVGVVCAVDMVTPSIDVWVLGAETFDVGDNLFIFADGNEQTAGDDDWGMAQVMEFGDGVCTPSWGTTDPPQRLTLLNPIVNLSAVRVGGMVRSFTTLTYGIYQVDGEWVLGRRKSGDAVVPLLAGLAPRGAEGLEFRYYRSDGTRFDPTTQVLRDSVARIGVRVGTQSRGRFGADGEFYRDSLVTQIHLRNG